MVIPDEEPSHRSGKKPMEQEPRIKKSRRHAKDRYEREKEDFDSDGFQVSQGKNPDRYQRSEERCRSQTMKDHGGSSGMSDSASTNETNFKKLER